MLLGPRKPEGMGCGKGHRNPLSCPIRRKIIRQGKAARNCSMPQQPHSGEQQGLHKDSIEGPASSTPLPSRLGGLWAASSSKTSHFPSHFLCAPRGPRVGTCGWDPRTPTLPLSTSVDEAQHLPPHPFPASSPGVLTFQRGSLNCKCSPVYATQRGWPPDAWLEDQ